MKAYRYNHETKKLEGQAECQIDPLESELAGKTVYLLPGDCTFEEPPEEKEGFDILFEDNAWTYKEQKQEVQEEYVPTEKEKAQQEIWSLKSKLNETDYKILKCSEASLRGAELPYDIESVSAERDEWRQQINELEDKLKSLETTEE